jgi:hypothetical protein
MVVIGVKLRFQLVCALLIFRGVAAAQEFPGDPHVPGPDPCGYPDTSSALYRAAAALNWGYGYDSLLADLGRWRTSPYVRVDSVGASVRSRALYVVTIEDTARVAQPRRRVWIHARTHPGEVQSTWVTNQIIALLLSTTPLGDELRRRCVFNIMPMVNPDGVELRLPRQNANGVDIESNWAVVPGEPEVQVLRGQFLQLMARPNPIALALNMHSANDCTRYFVFHAASGTSAAYAAIEQQFIGYVRQPFPARVKPWDYFVTWTSGAPTVYPESWFWYNHRENVLALTYEDMNCAAAGGYDTTAFSILTGIRNQLFGPTAVAAGRELPEQPRLAQNYPNPFNPGTTIAFELPASSDIRLSVCDVLGREVSVLVDERREAGSHEVRFDAAGLASGVYVCRLEAGGSTQTRTLLLVR